MRFSAKHCHTRTSRVFGASRRSAASRPPADLTPSVPDRQSIKSNTCEPPAGGLHGLRPLFLAANPAAPRPWADVLDRDLTTE